MTSAALALLLASAVAPPTPGVWSSSGEGGQARGGTGVAPPQGGPLSPAEPTGPSGGKGTPETPQEREQRLIREGIRRPAPQPVVVPPRDYLSVLGRRLDPEGTDPVRPASLSFGFGFASQAALDESPGRRSRYLGAHHVFGQVWSWTNRAAAAPGGWCSGTASATSEVPGSQVCSFSSLHILALASTAEVSLQGTLAGGEAGDGGGSKVAFDVLVSDFEAGFAFRHDWYRTLGSSGIWSFGPGVLVGYLPLRQRMLTRYGEARANLGDMRKSGVAFNALGTVSRVSFSAMALSIFEGTAFVGVVTGSPREVRLWGGLEFSLRAPVDRQATESEGTLGAEAAGSPASTSPPSTAQPARDRPSAGEQP